MIGEFISFFPISICISMILFLLFSKIDSKQKWSLLFLLSVLALFFSLEVVYSSEEVDYLSLSNAYLFAQLVVPALVPASWKLYQSVTGRKFSNILGGIWVIVPIVLFSISLIVRYLLGSDSIIDFHRQLDYNGLYPGLLADRIYKMYYLNTFILFYGVVFCENVLFIGYLVYEMVKTGFSFRNVFSSFLSYAERDITHLVQFILLLVFLVSSARALLSRNLVLTYIYYDYAIMILLSLAVIYLTCVVLFGRIEVTCENNVIEPGIDDSSKGQIDNAGNLLELQLIDVPEKTASTVKFESEPVQIPPQVPEDTQVTKAPAEPVPAKPATSFSSPQIAFMVHEETDDNSLSARFEHLLFKDKIFLSSGLTIVDVAEKLGTNKTYISRIVNSNYGMSFPDFINSLRIDYAEQYILHNVSAKQKDIAEACGFPSASAFNNTFKKITGLTPKIWMAANHIGK